MLGTASSLLLPVAMCQLALAQPMKSDVQASSITANSATTTWMTGISGDSRVNYGTMVLCNTAYDASSTASHSVTLTGLSPDTVHYHEVQPTNAWRIATDSNSDNYYRFTHVGFEGWDILGGIFHPATVTIKGVRK